MKKVVQNKSLLAILVIVFLSIFIIIPVFFSLFNGSTIGNVALIPINGPITGNGGGSFGAVSVSSQDIVAFIEDANNNPKIDAIVLEINSPGGSAVASDEIAAAIKKVDKPVVAYMREVAASGGYWIASAADYVVANRMTITGSIGVISSYVEFSQFMEEYGIGYERLVAGKHKDIGTPFKKLNTEEKNIMQQKLDLIHNYFIDEVAENRGLPTSVVEELATGRIFLGVEAKNNGLVDELGNQETVTLYLQNRHGLENIQYARYERQAGLFDLFAGVISQFSFQIGQGISQGLTQQTITI
jgi:protease IV